MYYKYKTNRETDWGMMEQEGKEGNKDEKN